MKQTKIPKLTDIPLNVFQHSKAFNCQVNMNLYVMCSISHETPATNVFTNASYVALS